MPVSIWIGYDSRQADAYAVCRASIRRHLRVRKGQPVPICGILLDEVRDAGLYSRPTHRKGGQLWDVISDAPMSTEFAISRFLTRHLGSSGLALFMDSDMLVRADLMEMFDQVDPVHAITCVKHRYEPPEGEKMDGQAQLRYARKNWSSFMVFNCDHPANRALTVKMVNKLPGRDLHRFSWLEDHGIGEIGVEWNWLVGHSDALVTPKVVHFTEGGPWLAKYADVPYANEWRVAAREVKIACPA